MRKVQKKNILKGLMRINVGFAAFRSYSIGKVYPRGTSLHLGEWLYGKVKK